MYDAGRFGAEITGSETMPLTLELLRARIMPYSAAHETTSYGFLVTFCSSELRCWIGDGTRPHQFNYTWDGNVIYQGTAYDDDLDAELDRCQKVMEDLDAKNSYVELRPCGCCQQNVNEDLLYRCHFCGESRCLHECFIESEGICKCCFYGNTEMDDDNQDPCCEHCEDHGRPGVYHTTTTGMLQRPLGELGISENYGTEPFY